MIFGLTTSTYTQVHIALSLVGIVSGFVVMYGLLTAVTQLAVFALFIFLAIFAARRFRSSVQPA